jgi:hypothetical protein
MAFFQSMPVNAEFTTVFAALRAILAAHKDKLKITQDTVIGFSTEALRLRHKGNPVSFGAVRIGKNYVSFHLVPVYMNPRLLEKISPELRKRMQGKGCFNFKTVDEELFRQLAELTAAGLACFEKGQFRWPGLEVATASKV